MITASNAVPKATVAVNRDDATPNIIVFGESGVGKSSLINMITGTDSAATSNEAVGCTFQSASYDVELKGRKYRLWDTIGLNEGERGTASPERSIQDLQSLVLNLQHEGVNLLVYCIRGSRIRDIIKINYDLFWKIICNEQVPIVVVVTGLENEEDMEEWWTNNRPDFAAREMRFHDHACVTTTKGKRMKNGEFMYAAEFELSIKLVRDLIVKRCPETPWKPDGSRWLIDIVQTMKQMFLQYESQSHGEGYGSHRSQAGNTPAMPDSLRQFVANMAMALDRP
ncbi:hypothetical protein M378DRAFT_28761 [Amanita muscaria Koide BX008]|uniref:G domain-containing protein n=1 Tax=Amanita muscaria (strain Koide BX008) TaxID=946122 RepID=A0A0C2RVU0_AMAMK|nr:hypothetical protein M378DRAFT_28761 [Amanita muscaria Koide BX008]